MMFRTESQKKEFCAECPVARVADLIGDSCSLLIVRDLMDGKKRFGELHISLEGISSRTLTNKLKILMAQKVIVRDKDGIYSLTKKGAALDPIIESMRSYGRKYL